MRYLLDTNTCIYAIKRRESVPGRLRELAPDDVAITTVTLAELWFGARKSSRSQQTRARVDAFLRPFSVLPFDRDAAAAYAEIRLVLEQRAGPIGERGLLIASIARSRRLKVVTHDVGEFSRVPGLSVEDWF